MLHKFIYICLFLLSSFSGMTAQTKVKLDTLFNLSQGASTTVIYQIIFPYPGQVTIHIHNWLSTYAWDHDYDRLYIYNDTSGPVNRNQFSSEADPFLFHMFQATADSPGVTFNIGQAGIYTIAVHAGDYFGQQPQTQNYQFLITEVACNDLYEPNDNMQQATLIALGSTITAYQWRRVNTAYVSWDEDWYKISINSPGQLKLVLCNWTPVMNWTTDFDRLYVYNGHGDPIGYGISVGSSAGDPYYEHMMYDSIHTTTMNLTHAGMYYFRYHSGDAYSGGLTPYTLTPSFTPVQDQFEPNDDFADAKLIPAIDTFYQAYEWRSVDSSMNITRDEDYYYFLAANAGTYSITLNNWIGIYNWSADYDFLIIYAADSSVVGANPLSWMMGGNPTITFNVPSAGKYYIRLHCGDGASLGGYSFKLSGNIVGVKEPNNTPKEFALSQNYPNPFNPTTTISFALPSRSFVSLKIFDLLGREVETIVSEEMSAGSYSRQWNAANMSCGSYFYRLEAGSFIQFKKLILLK